MKKCLLVLLSAGLIAIILNGCGRGLPDSGPQEETNPAAGQETAGGDGSAGTEADGSAPSYYGTWEVKDYQSAEVSALSAEDMEAFRGTVVAYQPDSVTVGGESVNGDNFTYAAGDAAYDYDRLTEDYRANLGEWWNGISEVERVTADAEGSFFGNEFFLADSDTVWIYYEGVFFLAKRVGG